LRNSCVGYNIVPNNSTNSNFNNQSFFGANILPVYTSNNSTITIFGSSNTTNQTGGHMGGVSILGYNNINTTITTNIQTNTTIGSTCFPLLSGTSTGFLVIGYNAGSTKQFGSNIILIGSGSNASSTTISNEITLGNASITALRCNATLSTLSDIRDKKNIEPLDKGLDFVDKLKPVMFDWNTRDGAKVDIPQIGFIAQDLLEIGADVPNLVLTNNADKLEASYDVLLPILIKAVQDLSAKVKIQQEILRMKLISKGMV
jgi:hypothetical protein